MNNSSVNTEAMPARARSAFVRIFSRSHPFLLAMVPILHLYSRNMNEADAFTALIFGCGALVMTLIVWFVARLWLGNGQKAALIASLFVVVFYAYGWIFDFVMQHEPLKMSYDRWHFVLVVFCVALVVAVSVVLRHSRRNLQQLSSFLSGVALIVMVMCLVRIGRNEVRMLAARKKSKPAASSSASQITSFPRKPPLNADSPDTPDVYYIILDGYARSDTLQRVCHCDNSDFLKFLTSRGFYVADQSCSNYPMTFMSIASSLNMCYLDEEVKSPGYSAVYALWDQPLVARVFQSKGYRFAYLATNFKSTLAGTDIVFQRRPSWLLNQFAESLLRTTALRLFEPQMADQHLYEFEMVKKIAQIKGPTFTFCHIIAPHPPYVFDRIGNICCDVPQSMFFKDGWEQQQNPSSTNARLAYSEQLQYVNKRMEEIVDSILAQSTVPPIIILQGDHGTFFTLPSKITDESLDQFAEERMPILNAYLVPEKMRQKLRPDISPVNSFRLLFHECFGEHFEILPEKHMVGWYYGPQQLKDATSIVHPSAVRQASVAGSSDLSAARPH